jgi:hypothetical protein
MALRPVAAARRRFSTGILPDGVRTFLSKFQIRARRLGRTLGSKNSERRSGPEAEIGKPANACTAKQAAGFRYGVFESQRREVAKVRAKSDQRRTHKPHASHRPISPILHHHPYPTSDSSLHLSVFASSRFNQPSPAFDSLNNQTRPCVRTDRRSRVFRLCAHPIRLRWKP